MSRSMQSMWTACLVLAACGGPSASPADDSVELDAGAPPDASGAATTVTGKAVAVAGGPTDTAELVHEISVGRTEQDAPHVVALRLTTAQLPGLVTGDRLIAPVELQLTTRCDIGQTAPGCDYNPDVRAEIILADAASATSGVVIATQHQICTKDSHHCMFVFQPDDASVTLGAAMSCVSTGTCVMNVVAWAWNPQARAGGVDKILVGANDGNYLDNGIVSGDGARVMAVRERDITVADRTQNQTSAAATIGINTNADPVLVYSQPLGLLRAGEQFVIEAKLVVQVSSRARVSSEMFVTDDPSATDGVAVDAIVPAHIGEQNGYNCSAATSPCTQRKVAVFRVVQDTTKPMFIHIAVKSAVPGGAPATVGIRRPEGWLRSTRYAAALRD